MWKIVETGAEVSRSSVGTLAYRGGCSDDDRAGLVSLHTSLRNRSTWNQGHQPKLQGFQGRKLESYTVEQNMTGLSQVNYYSAHRKVLIEMQHRLKKQHHSRYKNENKFPLSPFNQNQV